LDLNVRARVHCLEKELAAASKNGLVETNAGVRSVMIEYDARALSLPDLLASIEAADAAIGDVAHMVLPSRIVHLPMAFDERCVLSRRPIFMPFVCPARMLVFSSSLGCEYCPHTHELRFNVRARVSNTVCAAVGVQVDC
jgi:allophanate hydrolase subunit 1